MTTFEGINRAWNGGATVGQLYRVTTPEDLSRVGNGWMWGRLKLGDLLLCRAHAGDSFYQYQLVEVGGNFVELHKGIVFGAYWLGKPTQWQPDESQLKVLLDGDSVITTDLHRELTILGQLECQAETLRRLGVLKNLEPGDIVKVSSAAKPRETSGSLAVVLANQLMEPEAKLHLNLKGVYFSLTEGQLDQLTPLV